MRSSVNLRPARLLPLAFAIGLAAGACTSTAAPGWTFAPPPPATPSPAASAAPSAGASAGASTGASPSAASSAGAPASSGGGGTAIKETAQNIAFVVADLTAPANQAFQITFDNEDPGVPHNIEIKQADGSVAFKGAIVTGVITTTYDVPALAAGTYPFQCTVHPNMTGTLTVK
ncbi:MAG: cupredoxin domain-containing protein [Chloroflexi bacterium]|nr:cupredoxin domain-containing protein [Chloroflexota bacterium]